MGQFTREQLEKICKERKKDFRSMSLHDCDFTGMDLERADFRSARLPYSKFVNCNLRYANFEGSNVMFTTWKGADLHRSNFKDAIMSDADMRDVKDFFGATFTMNCNSWKNLKVSEGFWLGFLFYGLLMEPPSEEWKEKLQLFFGPEKYSILKNLYMTRQM
jgi:hypothetical protein